MLSEKLQAEALRTYLFFYSSQVRRRHFRIFGVLFFEVLFRVFRNLNPFKTLYSSPVRRGLGSLLSCWSLWWPAQHHNQLPACLISLYFG
jgi:hypothetical protein